MHRDSDHHRQKQYVFTWFSIFRKPYFFIGKKLFSSFETKEKVPYVLSTVLYIYVLIPSGGLRHPLTKNI